MNETTTYSGEMMRIDQYLPKEYPFSRNFFHHLITRGAIKVMRKGYSEAKIIKKSFLIRTNDSIIIESLDRFCDGGLLDETPDIDLEIKRETDDYVIIYKPKGVLSHPNSIRDMATPSVVGGIYHYYKKKHGILPSSANFIRAGLIHRLDKDTDGLMVIAKTEKGLVHFKSYFQQKSIAPTIQAKENVPLKKFYSAISLVNAEGLVFLHTIKNRLPHIIDEDVIPNTPHPIIKRGITKILDIVYLNKKGVLVEENPYKAEIQLEILTGRTHQIRYHLSSKGLPIMGDYLYGKEKKGTPMQLTACKLVFPDMDGTITQVTI